VIRNRAICAGEVGDGPADFLHGHRCPDQPASDPHARQLAAQGSDFTDNLSLLRRLFNQHLQAEVVCGLDQVIIGTLFGGQDCIITVA